MSKHGETKAEASSEKAYASAAESLADRREAGKPARPPRSRRARKAAPAAPSDQAGTATAPPADTASKPHSGKPAIVTAKPVAKPVKPVAKSTPARTTAAKPLPTKPLPTKPASAKPGPMKAVPIKSEAKPLVARAAAAAVTEAPAPAVSVAAPEPPAPPSPAPAETPSASTASIAKTAAKTVPFFDYDLNPLVSSYLKDNIMDMTSNYAAGLKDAMSDVQGKAKDALAKSSHMMGGVNDFTRANVEACVESSKILAAGLQELGTSLVAEGRSAFEDMTADLKGLASAKSPAEFLRLQGEMIRKSIDGAVANSSKNSEAVMKLAGEAFAPISGRVSVAVDKVRVPS